jgi:hypothetical protein
MASTRSILLSEVMGQIGQEIVIKQYAGKTIISRYPDMSRRKLSKKQKEMNELMFDANAEAKTVMANEKLRIEAQARLNVTRNKLYTALVGEYIRTARQSM